MKTTLRIITLVIFLSTLPSSIYGQYCASTATSTADSRCDGVQLAGNTITLNNPTSTCGTYTDYTTGPNVPDLTPASGYTVNITNGTCGGNYTRWANAWIDFNNDGDFADANEMLGAGTTGNATNLFVHVINFTVPAGATAGNTTMRVIVKESGNATNPCATYTWGETEDYTVNIQAAAPMAYTSNTVTQGNTAVVEKCASNQEIIGVQVVTTGGSSPLDITQFRIRTNGSTAPLIDVSNIDIYYTGTNSTFATTTFFGNAAPLAVGNNIFINGTQTLSSGTNYFWVVYDMAAGSTIGNLVDALCNRITVDGTNYVPSTTNPAGSRTITVCNPTPGGTSQAVPVWIKGNSGTTPSTGTGTLTNWSNNGTAGAITINGIPTFEEMGYNYNPKVHFNGNGNFLGHAGIIFGSIYAVVELEDLSRTYTHLSTWTNMCGGPHADGTLHGGINTGNSAFELTGYCPEFEGAGAWKKNGYVLGHTANYSGSNEIISAVANTGDLDAYGDRLLGGQPCTPVRDWLGDASEVIVLTGTSTNAERNQIETYLAVKYGLTLANTGGGTQGDYISTNGSTIWDASNSTNYHNDVIGIGRDDNEGLQQKQSHTSDDTTRIYIDALATTNVNNAGSFSTDASYVLMGHNQGAMRNSPGANAEVPGSCGLYSRLEREWKVTTTNMTDNYGIDFKLTPGANQAAVTVAHLRLLVDDDGDFSNGGTTCYFNGDAFGTVISYSSPVISVTGISTTQIANNSTSFITIGSTNGNTPLPVEVVSFDVTCENNEVLLNWITTSEINNDFFTLERSEDALDFESIATIEGAGNSSSLIHYSWLDESPIKDVSYYRLKQTDFNGEIEFHGVVPVRCKIKNDITIYPNPFEDNFTVQLAENTTDPLTVVILDYMGRKVHHEIIDAYTAIITLDSQLPPGNYFVKVFNKTIHEVERIVKLN